MKLSILTLTAFLLTSFCFSQENIDEDKTLSGQFDKIYRTSTTYKPKGIQKRYKVIDIKKYEQLKSNVLDSLSMFKQLVLEKENLLKAENATNEKVNSTLIKAQGDLEIALNKENSISFFGIQLNKTFYNIILWGIIIVLLLGLFYFIFKFYKSNVDTKKAEGDLLDVEEEFEKHRKKTLEKEQKLRRQLQDEINKQRNS